MFLGCAIACLALPAAASAATQTFGFTGGPQSFTVPAGVTQVTIEACGAEGGDGTVGGAGGQGGCATATIGGLASGETLAVFVGGQGANGQGGLVTPSVGGAGGFNGGAAGGASPPTGQAGGGGGGASDVRRGGSDLDDRVVVGGGGGGGGSGGGTPTSNVGGAGGGITGGTGGNGAGASGGGGGDQNDGGDGGTGGPDPDGQPGQLGLGGQGANGTCCGGGGGGGGYYGGGGGEGGAVIAAAGGGGGSSFPVAATHQQGVRSGNGQITISFSGQATPPLTTNASNDVELGGAVQDVANLAGGFNPDGEITFRLYGPDDGTCSGTPVFTDTVAVSGNGDYTSASFTPTQAGTYRWVASYSGDADNAPIANACDDASERVRVLAPPNEPPRIDNLRLVPDEFFASGRRTPLKGGTSIRFTLSEPATVHFRVRRDPPRKNGGPPPKHSHRFTRELDAGPQKVFFTGTLDGRTFKPGDYLMFARAVDDEGLSSERQSAPFTILGAG